ncbi:MAG: 2-oxo acid dehydrogenase subunit E2 [Bdellovibrionales bacterium]|nr:2-oxo acid dehydrogenase subunit E2 [Bdellovibrionales bacterium]
MITKNVNILPAQKLTSWRKISMGSWRPNGDSHVYCEIRVNAEQAVKKIKAMSASSGQKITMTHFMGKVMGKVLKEVPDLNVLVRLNNIYARRDVDIFFQVSLDETELSGHVVRCIDTKSLASISQELTDTVVAIRKDEDQTFKKIKQSWNAIPTFMAKCVLDVIAFVSYTLNLNIKGSNVPKDCFGSMMITNIGSLGFSSAFVPLAPYTRIPLVLALGKTELRPVCREDGTVTSEQQISLCFTFDHRVMDGAQGAKMSFAIKKYFINPDLLDA